MYEILYQFFIFFQLKFGCNFVTCFTVLIFWIILFVKFLNRVFPFLRRLFYKIYFWTNLLILNAVLNLILIFLSILKIFDTSIQLLLIYNLVKCTKEILDKILLYFNSVRNIGKKRKLSDDETHLHLEGKSVLILSELIDERSRSRNTRNVSQGYFLFSRNNEVSG